MKNLIFILILIFSNQIYSQLKKNVDYRKIVLNKSIVGKKFTFGKWDEKGNDELELTYLGVIKTNKKTYKIMNSIWYWGTSGRATSRILIFNDRNKFLGDYYLTLTCEVPKRIKNNSLQFQSDCEENSQKKITNISFTKGIPKYLIVNYNEETQLISTFDEAE